MVSLRERDAIEDGIESTVSAAVEAVSCASRRGSLQWRDPGVSRELGIGREPVARSEDSGERAGCEQVDPAETSERCEPLLRQRFDPLLEVSRLHQRELETLGEHPDCESTLLAQETYLERAIRL
jgi:hypothetical protein